MSTIYDRAVRALHPVFREMSDRFGPSEPLSYYCGGPERRCNHRTCAAVSALVEEDLLNYAPPVSTTRRSASVTQHLGTVEAGSTVIGMILP